jgi:hypothetical protein
VGSGEIGEGSGKEGEAREWGSIRLGVRRVMPLTLTVTPWQSPPRWAVHLDPWTVHKIHSKYDISYSVYIITTQFSNKNSQKYLLASPMAVLSSNGLNYIKGTNFYYYFIIITLLNN